VGFSLLGTAISSITFLAYPGSAFAGNWSRLVPGFMLPVAAFIGVIFFVVFYRRSGFVSAYEYYEKRFASWGRSYASLVYIVSQVFRVGSVLFLLALPVRVMTGWSLPTIILTVGVLVTLYTVLGGLEAVIWTDVLQTIVLILGGLVTIAVVFLDVKGGLGEVIRMAGAAGKFKISTSWDWNFTRDTFWTLAIIGLIGNVQEFSTDQVKIQRYLAPATDREAKGAAWMVGLGCIPIWMLFMFVGTSIWVFYQLHPGLLSSTLRPDEVFPHFILTQLPVGIGGFVIAAVMAAAMSTIDSGLNAVATIMTVDWYQKFFVKNREDKHYLDMARVLTLVVGILGIAAAYFLSTLEMRTFLDLAFFLSSVFSAGLGGFFLLGFFFKRANNQGAIVGVVVGLLVILWLTLSNMTTFKVTDQTLTTLHDSGMNTELVQKVASIKGKTVRGKGEFFNQMEDILGREDANHYKSLILESAESTGIFPLALSSSVHPFAISVFGNLAVLLVGWLASFFWPAPTEEELRKTTWWTRNG
jgi:SSS family solute:Na+ symporter